MIRDVAKFQVGDIVFSTLDEGVRGMVTGVLFRPGHVVYKVSWSPTQPEMECYDIELSGEQRFDAAPGAGGEEAGV